MQPQIVYYSDRSTRVEPGDYIQLRIFLKKYTGRVVYVPGVSASNPNMDFNGLYRVGIQIPDGPFVATNVLSEGSCLKKKIRFLKRGAEGIAELAPGADPFADEE